MNIKEKIENHPFWFFASYFIVAFIAGWTAYLSVQSASGRISVSQEQAKRAEQFEQERQELVARLDRAERDRNDLQRQLSALQQSRQATAPPTGVSRSAAGGTRPLESPVPASQAHDNLNSALLTAMKIPDHRLRDNTIIRIACQALRQGVADVAESAADSLSSAKTGEKAGLKSAAQAIASPHRTSLDWTTICN